MIGAINELKRDKKLKIENQRKIKILREECNREIEQAAKIKKNRLILTNFKEEIKHLKKEFVDANEELEESAKLPSKAPRIKGPPKSTTSTNLKSLPHFVKTTILSTPQPSKVKTGIVLPKINSIFSKKKRTQH